jgi:hypothetical protein
MLAVEGVTVTATVPFEGAGFWLEEERAEEFPQAARNGARRRNKHDEKAQEEEDIVADSLAGGEGLRQLDEGTGGGTVE